jgi:hypothetical protein
MADEQRQIHITRKGEQFGPYPETTAKQFLEDGQLLASDLAWHTGAEGWKPLGELFGTMPAEESAPPPPPAGPTGPPPEEPPAPTGPPPDTPVHISRQGERHGPYKYTTAREYLETGSLLPTDNAWYEGCDGWKPLAELLGGQPAAVAAQPAGPATYSMGEEENLKQMHMMVAGVLLIVGAVLPVFGMAPSMEDGKMTLETKIRFPNFLLSGKNFEFIVALLGPLVVGITAAAMAKTTKDPVRCSVILGLAALTYLISMDANRTMAGALGGFGVPVIFFLGWLCLLMGCRVRHMRPANLAAYIISLVGAGFVFLYWLVPGKTGGVPLVATFKMFDGSVVEALGMAAFMGMQIGAGVICCITTRTKPSGHVARFTDLAIKLSVGSIVTLLAFGALGEVIEIFKGSGDIKFSTKLKEFLSGFSMILKVFISVLGLLLIYPVCASDLMTRLLRR